jgi:hypothetical protein
MYNNPNFFRNTGLASKVLHNRIIFGSGVNFQLDCSLYCKEAWIVVYIVWHLSQGEITHTIRSLHFFNHRKATAQARG